MEAQLYLLKPAPPGRKFKEDTQMERNPNQKTSLKKTFSTQNLVMMAALIAIQIILTRFFSIQTDTDRKSVV